MSEHTPRHRRARRGWRPVARPPVLVGLASAAVAAVTLVVVHEGGADRPETTPAAAMRTVPPSPGSNGANLEPRGDGGDARAPGVERPNRPQGAAAFAVPEPSPPVRVEIPSIDVSSPLVGLALDDDGAMEAPSDYGVAGWFTPGPQPGQPGPAVIAGHVDSRDGPAVFYRLAELAPGDEVVVHRADGTGVRFTVTDRRQYPKDEFPADAVYGPVPGPELRLITCGGEFDRSSHSYRDNLVVYATGPTATTAD